jgi:hypothetical protein
MFFMGRGLGSVLKAERSTNKRIVGSMSYTFLLIVFPCILGLGLLFSKGYNYSYPGVLVEYGVPVMSPSFADLRFVTSAAECIAKGIDISEINPCDPWKRKNNLPATWNILSYLGVTGQSTPWIALGFITLFFIVIFCFIGPVTFFEGLYYGSFVASPAIILLIERGNVDLLILVLVLSPLAIGKKQCELLRAVFFALAAALKVFPIFAAFSFLFKREKLKYFFIFLFLFSIYAFPNRSDFHRVFALTERWHHYSFGSNVLEAYLIHERGMRGTGGNFLVSRVLLFLFASASAWLGFRSRIVQEETPDMESYRVGYLIFCSFFCSGQSWDYHLWVLFLCLPLIFRGGVLRHAERVALLILILVTVYYQFPLVHLTGRWFFFLKVFREIITWILFLALTFHFFRFIPQMKRQAST